MAHKKGQGSTRNGRDSNAQYRGVKLYDGQTAKPGAILIRQLGLLVSEAVIQFRINTLEGEILVALFKPWNELRVNHRLQFQNLSTL